MSEKSTPTRTIPIGRNVDLASLSQSVGGTWYGTTPGGTRIIYDRNTLLNYKSSPMAKTPPVNMPSIPGVTTTAGATTAANNDNHHQLHQGKRGQHQHPQQHHGAPHPVTTAPTTSTTASTALEHHVKDDSDDVMFQMDD